MLPGRHERFVRWLCGSIDLRRVPVDQAAIRRAILRSGMPHADVWAADWR